MGKTEKLPLGIGQEFKSERNKDRLPAVEVNNKVLWVNPAFKEAPFKLEEGKPTNLGFFLTNIHGAKATEKTHTLIIMPEIEEGRSGLIGSVVFQDDEGRMHRDIDIKGMGRFQTNPGGSSVAPVRPRRKEREASGLHDYLYALRDRKFSEEFLKAGIRTYRIVAVIQPEEIIGPHGDKISIEEAKGLGILPKKMDPVFEVRAFGTKERINYISSYAGTDYERRRLSLKDAMTLVAQELGLEPNKFSFNDYLKWFAATLGQEVAKIRKLGAYHGYITEHNITLDCRIVDLDSVEWTHILLKDPKDKSDSEESFYNSDYASASYALGNLGYNMKQILTSNSIANHKDILDIYQTAYEEELKKEKKIEEE